MSDEPLIRLEGVTKVYDMGVEKVHALRGVDVSIRDNEYVAIMGTSGSGKSTAINALEDDGYYCLDNLPTELVPQFVDLCARSGEGRSRVALGLDLRDLSYTERWPGVQEELAEAGHRVRVIFLEAGDDVLIRRYSETRRAHLVITT